MPIGSAAPDFTLPGIDGRAHSLADYAGSRVLAVVFTGNSCPASQLYEARLPAPRRLPRPRRDARRHQSEQAGRLGSTMFSHTDVGESLDDMKARAAHRRIEYPYLSDGEAQAVAKQFGVVATPHIFVFDQARTLRYQGRIDDSPREDAVTSRDARNAIDAVLADSPAPIGPDRASRDAR